jgi:hypothetical protein
MLVVKVTRKVTRPEFQIFTDIVEMNADKLTPGVARSAVRFVGGTTGTVTCGDVGYKVYPKSVRKFYIDVEPEPEEQDPPYYDLNDLVG